MTTNKPEVVAWRWCKPVVNDQGKTVGVTAWELGEAPGFLPWWANDPLIRLSDYERLQAMHDKLLKHLQHLIDQTTPLEPEPGNPMWSRRIQLDEVIAERDSLRAECEKLRKDAERDLSYANSVIADQNNALKAMGKAGIMFVPVPVLDDAEKARYLKLMNDQLRRAEELAIGGDE